MQTLSENTILLSFLMYKVMSCVIADLTQKPDNSEKCFKIRKGERE